MIFVLDTAIGIGVWVPYTIGKTAALLSVGVSLFFDCFLSDFLCPDSLTLGGCWKSSISLSAPFDL